MTTYSLQSLAQLVNGRIVGDPSTMISNALPQRDAVEGCITLADSEQQAVKANETKAAAVVLSEPCSKCTKPMLIVSNLHTAFTDIVAKFRPEPIVRAASDEVIIAASAVVDKSASIGSGTRIGERVIIGEHCQIGKRCTIHPGVTMMTRCVVGDDCEIYPGCVLYHQTIVGDRALIHANAVLGAYGFGYKQRDGKHERTAQLGWVELGADVEIGAGTTIDRGTYGITRIGKGTKVDNQVQIGHNCHIGEHNLLCAQVGIAGSCTTGNYVVMGGQVGMADHLSVSDRAMIAAQSGLMNDVSEGEVVVGTPAAPRRQKFLEIAITSKLPEMRKELRAMISRLEALEQQVATSELRCTNGSSRDAA